MTTKAKEALELSDIQYDATAEQDIPLTLHQNGKEFEVRHRLAPLTDERFIKYLEKEEAANKTVQKTQKLTTAQHNVKADLWNDLAVGVTGYKTREDFRDGVHFTHKKEAIDALLEAQIPDDDDNESTSDGWDIDALVTIPFKAMFSGALITNLSHSFRPESKEEIDEFLAIEYNQPSPRHMASAKHRPQAERFAELGRELLKETTGYKPGTEVPAWHLAKTTQVFFWRQIIQAGKSPA
jgi:hypothetical protein